ncbi:hypothetical protein [Vreelandella sp. TE19]
MHSQKAVTTTLGELVLGVIPNLNLAEKLVFNTLESLIESASDPFEVIRRKEQKEHFTLEVYRLRLALEVLLERHRRDVNALLADEHHPTEALWLSEDEELAVAEAIAIYQRVRAFQRGERSTPIHH